MDSKALEAAANVICVQDMAPGPADMLSEVSDDIANAYRELAERIVAAYLDEAGTPIRWCKEHGCLRYAYGHEPISNCVITDAVLVIGGNE